MWVAELTILQQPSQDLDARVILEQVPDHEHGVALSGPDTGIGGCETLGRFEGVQADGQWHAVRFDLLKALRDKHPLDGLLMVWMPVLANHSNHEYLLAGFGGNRAGATYWLRNVRLETASKAARLSRRPAAPAE